MKLKCFYITSIILLFCNSAYSMEQPQTSQSQLEAHALKVEGQRLKREMNLILDNPSSSKKDKKNAEKKLKKGIKIKTIFYREGSCNYVNQTLNIDRHAIIALAEKETKKKHWVHITTYNGKEFTRPTRGFDPNFTMKEPAEGARCAVLIYSVLPK